jgi:hypothetical protein
MDDKSTLAREIEWLKLFALDNCEHVPQIIWEGSDSGFRALIIPRYSIDLGRYFLAASQGFDPEAQVTLTAVFACDMVR